MGFFVLILFIASLIFIQQDKKNIQEKINQLDKRISILEERK